MAAEVLFREDVVQWLVHFFAQRHDSADFAHKLVLSSVRRKMPFFSCRTHDGNPVSLSAAEADAGWQMFNCFHAAALHCDVIADAAAAGDVHKDDEEEVRLEFRLFSIYKNCAEDEQGQVSTEDLAREIKKAHDFSEHFANNGPVRRALQTLQTSGMPSRVAWEDFRALFEGDTRGPCSKTSTDADTRNDKDATAKAHFESKHLAASPVAQAFAKGATAKHGATSKAEPPRAPSTPAVVVSSADRAPAPQSQLTAFLLDRPGQFYVRERLLRTLADENRRGPLLAAALRGDNRLSPLNNLVVSPAAVEEAIQDAREQLPESDVAHSLSFLKRTRDVEAAKRMLRSAKSGVSKESAEEAIRIFERPAALSLGC